MANVCFTNAGVWTTAPSKAASLSAPPAPIPRGVLDAPDAPIAGLAAAGSRLPLLTLPARRAPPKRIRSFGDLGSADNLPCLATAVARAGGTSSGPRAANGPPSRRASAVSLASLAEDDDDAAVVPPLSGADYSSADMADDDGDASSDEEGGGVRGASRLGLPPRAPRRGADGAPAPGPRAPPPASRSSLIDAIILTEWAARAHDGLFRYSVAGLPTRVLGGDHGFVAQFNEGRLTKKRPTEFSVDAVVQAFDPSKFHFGKAAQKEVLACLARDGAPGTRASWAPAAPAGSDPSLLLINVSPIEYGHVLIVPRVLSGLPQLIDAESLALALRFAAEADNPYLRLCFNSLGAYGTVNHLHFQAYFMATPFPVEVAACAPVARARARVPPSVHVSTLAGYPARALVFEAAAGDLDALAGAVAAAAGRLAAVNAPHNVFVADCGQRAFLFPNVFAAAKAAGRVPADLIDTCVDPACFELAGHMVFKRGADFDAPADAALALVWRLLAAATPDEAAFEAIVDLALGL
jgi:GDP-L-galactose phosphorylase